MNAVTPHLNVSEWFETNIVKIYLGWTTKNGVSYNISVDPELAINYTGRTSVQLSSSYNIKYNISVTASLCGKNSTTLQCTQVL